MGRASGFPSAGDADIAPRAEHVDVVPRSVTVRSLRPPTNTRVYILRMEPLVVAMKVRGDLSLDEIETFLGNARIPLRIACRTPSERLWMVSLWFQYRDGQLHCSTSKEADVVRYLDHDGHVAFEVSTNDIPYSGVRGHGSASVTDDPEKEVLRELLEQYMDGTENALGRRLLSEERDEVTITIDPSRVYGWDFSDRSGGSDA